MAWIRRTWGSLTGGERLIIATALLAVGATVVLGAIAFVKRPADISNPDVGFEAGTPTSGRGSDAGQEGNRPDNRIDWPRYGYDRERTKFVNIQKIRPPFRQVWRYEQDQLIEFAPIVHGPRMYFIDNDGIFVSLNVDTGKVIWKRDHGELNASSPALVGGVLYAVNLSPPQALAVRARDGKALWTQDLPARAESSPMVVRGRMYFGTESGDFFALRARDGKVLWQTKLSGAVKAAPAFVNNTLYVGDYAGQMYAIRAGDGQVLWQTQDLGVGAGQSGRFYSTPAVAFGRVYVGNVDGRAYSFDRQTGEIAWTHSAGDFVYSGVAAGQTRGTRPAVYFGSHDKNVYALDAESGEVIWTAQPGGQVSGPATVIGDVAYVSTFSGNATAGFDLGTGRRVFKYDDGEYGPVVTDGEHLFVAGGASVTALKPVDLGGRDYESPEGYKGVVPAGQLRRIRNEGRAGGGSKPRRAADRNDRQRGSARRGGNVRKGGRPSRRQRGRR